MKCGKRNTFEKEHFLQIFMSSFIVIFFRSQKLFKTVAWILDPGPLCGHQSVNFLINIMLYAYSFHNINPLAYNIVQNTWYVDRATRNKQLLMARAIGT